MWTHLALTALLVQAGPPGDAVALARTALEQVLAQHGQEGRVAADAWRTLARAQWGAGDATGSAESHRQQLAIREHLHERPSDTMDLVICEIELGGSLRAAELYAEALQVFERVPPQLEQIDGLGLTLPVRAQLRVGYLNGYAQVRLLMGEVAAAQHILEEALLVAIEGLGDGHANTQVVRHSLAATLVMTGQMERARELATKALAAVEIVCGPDHVKTAHAAYVLGSFLQQSGRADEALPLFERALRIRQEKLGPTHPSTLAAKTVIAQLLCLRPDQAAARAALTELLDEVRASVGPDHNLTLSLEVQLAEVLTEGGEAATALPLARHVLLRRRAVSSDRSYEVVNARTTLSRVLHALGQFDQAIAELEQALADDDGADPQRTHHIHQRLANFLPAVGREQEALVHARANLRAFPRLLAAYLPAMLDRERVAFTKRHRQDLDQILSWSLSASEVAAAHADAIAWKAQVARGLFAERAWLRRHLDAAACERLDELQGVLVALAAAQQKGDQTEVTRLGAQRNRIEQALPASARDTAAATDPQTIYARLQPRDALVDFYVYERSDRLSARGQQLMAFVVKGGEQRPVRVDLGPLEPVAQALQAHLKVIARRTKALNASARAAADAVAARARTLLWQPLAVHLAGTTRAFVCIDGVVALLPFGTLPGDEPGTFLVERFELCSLVSPLDLLPQAMATASATASRAKAVLVGNVDYGAADGARHFAPLPHTAAEIRTIGEVLAANAHDVVALAGDRATGSGLQAAVVGAQLVHMATHGEFAAPGLTSVLPGQRGGVALAGANTRGLFTSDEMAWLDLHACELVVLSACDTGAGELTAGEHLLGLRRALRLAGARRTVTSAWQIDDAATAALMVDFYRRLCAGAAPWAALREAQLALLAKNRQATGDAMPATWGAFVVEGG